MNGKAYDEGRRSVRRPEKNRVGALRGAVRDCREMGWSRLGSYLRGKLDFVEAYRRARSGDTS